MYRAHSYSAVCKSFDFAEIYQIFFHNLLSVRRGEGRTPRGGAAPLSPHIVTYSFHIPKVTLHYLRSILQPFL